MNYRPSPPPEVASNVLQLLIREANEAGIAQYQASRGRSAGRGPGKSDKGSVSPKTAPHEDKERSSKRAREEHDASSDAPMPPLKRRKTGDEAQPADNASFDAPSASDSAPHNSNLTPKPAMLSSLTIGINQVTKQLESQLRTLTSSTRIVLPTTPTPTPSTSAPSLSHVLVCLADTDPVQLVAHIPHLVAAYNSRLPSSTSHADAKPIQLIPLPLGASSQLAKALGTPSASVIGIAVSLPAFPFVQLNAITHRLQPHHHCSPSSARSPTQFPFSVHPG